MPKRVLHGEGMWTSTKLSECPEWAIPFYPWIYPLADANGSFELTNSRVVWTKVAPILPSFTPEKLDELLAVFSDHGLLFIWDQDGKRYGHWVGSDKPGRLPQPARRTARYGPVLAPTVPAEALREYVLRHRMCRVATQRASHATPKVSPVLDLVLDLDLEGAKPAAKPASAPRPRDPRHQLCFEIALQGFRTRYGVTPTWKGKDHRGLKDLLRACPFLAVEEFARRWDFYLKSTDHFVASQGSSLCFFCSRFDSFLNGPILAKENTNVIDAISSSIEASGLDENGRLRKPKPN
jgi:hypothetical protein